MNKKSLTQDIPLEILIIILYNKDFKEKFLLIQYLLELEIIEFIIFKRYLSYMFVIIILLS